MVTNHLLSGMILQANQDIHQAICVVDAGRGVFFFSIQVEGSD